MLVERAVLVSGQQAALLLNLCGPTITEWQTRGRPFPDELKAALGDLARAAKAANNPAPSGHLPTPPSATFRPFIMDGVSTRTAAQHLGVTPRAVIDRLHRGTLHGAQQADGTWLVDAAQPALATAGRVGNVAAPWRPTRPTPPSEVV